MRVEIIDGLSLCVPEEGDHPGKQIIGIAKRDLPDGVFRLVFNEHGIDYEHPDCDLARPTREG